MKVLKGSARISKNDIVSHAGPSSGFSNLTFATASPILTPPPRLIEIGTPWRIPLFPEDPVTKSLVRAEDWLPRSQGPVNDCPVNNSDQQNIIRRGTSGYYDVFLQACYF